jgi:hypothetical protein
VTAPQDLTATHSHLYPGARGSAAEALRDGAVMLSFADGTRVPGRLQGERLMLEAHRTAKGTRIAPKTWIIAPDPPGPDGRVPFRVAARAD